MIYNVKASKISINSIKLFLIIKVFTYIRMAITYGKRSTPTSKKFSYSV